MSRICILRFTSRYFYLSFSLSLVILFLVSIIYAVQLNHYDSVSDSEQAMNYQITLLLTSFVYLDVITQQIPAVQSVYDTPMILLFFIIVLVMQVVLIVGKLL